MIKNKLKPFLKIVGCVILFVLIFATVICVIVNTTKPQRLLTNFESDVATYDYLDARDGFYLGDLTNGRITGEGKYVLTSGSSYDGVWNNKGNPEGKGLLVIKDIGNYDGDFSDGQRNGNGTFTWTNGDSYTGEWKNDQISGSGTLTFSNGNSLTGTFDKNDFVSGDLTAKLDVGTIKISIVEDKTNTAILSLNDGTNYSGSLSNGKFNGDCKINYANGDKYNGNVKDNLKSGTGVYTWKNKASYSGSWSGDKMNGNGTYYYTESTSGKRLQGEFKDNIPTKSMIYYDKDGKKYQTTWNGSRCTKVVRS